MRTLKYLVGSAFVLAMVAASPARADITGSAHDLSAGVDELCVYCHTPHNGDTATAMAEAPLWNRDMLVTSFAMYGSPTIDMTIAADPQGVSLACLSCHDGATGYNSVLQANWAVSGDGTIMSGARAVGSDGLGNDHPISVTYNEALDTDFKTLVVASAALPFYDLPATSSGDQVECATCHDPHNGIPTNPSFLRIDNTGSTLCLTCHSK